MTENMLPEIMASCAPGSSGEISWFSSSSSPWQIQEVYSPGLGADVDGGPFPCQQCHRVYKYKRNLTSHQRLSCGKERQFLCLTCGKRFAQKVHLRTHHRSCDRKNSSGTSSTLSKILQNPKKFATDAPSISVIKLSKIAEPSLQKSKFSIEENELHIPHCSFGSISSSTEINRIRPIFTPRYRCPRCATWYSHKNSLNEHLQFENCAGQKLKCPWCDETFRLAQQLTVHVARHKHAPSISVIKLSKIAEPSLQKSKFSIEENELHIPHCSFGSISSSTEINRIRPIFTPRYRCPRCATWYSHKNSLNEHLQFENCAGQKLKCPWCDETFRLAQQLTVHVARHKRQE
ncbi:zinc finger protein 425-like [Ctenocephalides felis]|uniref:zinc finger protein 425-like n=1 Tax=Ctenocephalides felis TaxID=7515 RepID=UPI000E6E1238|nr:zinc finger protein 425-like [Ctenocephalides felis]